MKKTYRVISLFAGCGGTDLGMLGGFEYLGKRYPRLPVKVVWANEWDEAAAATYRRNIGDHVHVADVRSLDVKSLPDCDVVTGGFPCTTFSLSGKRGGFDDERGLLYKSMLKVVEEKQPMAFIAENVKGLLSIQDGGAMGIIKGDFAKSGKGYEVQHRLLKCVDYGLPQTRERVIIVGIRRDLAEKGVKFEYPRPTHGEGRAPYVTAGEALGDLLEKTEGSEPNHFWSKANWLPGRQGNTVVNLNRPGPTMRAEHHGNVEAVILKDGTRRRLSAREAATLQSFPRDFIFERSTSDAYRQAGNAVPPILAHAVMRRLIKALDGLNP